MPIFYDVLLEVLTQDERLFATNGEFLRNVAFELGYKGDLGLLRLLLSNDAVRDNFFVDVDGTMVFDGQKFGWVVNNREFLPDSYTRFKNTIGLVGREGRSIAQGRDVELVWAYKDCVLEGGQTKEEQKRDEVFYNETLAPDQIDSLLLPKALTGAQRHTAEGAIDTMDFGATDNLLLGGNNLLGLASLLPRYRNQVNLIYIDPPFNTERDDFRYNDRFARSTWLTFMKTRLELARQLLAPSGNIFIHINDEQYPYLAVLCNEVLGEQNYVDTIIWSYGSASGGRAATAKLVGVHDFILHFARDRAQRAAYKIYTPYSEAYIRDWFKYTDEDGRQYRKRQYDRDGESVWERQYLDESPGVPGTTVWTDIKQIYADPRAFKEDQKKHSEITGYDSQKPEKLLHRILEHTTRPGDLVLDFFSGSGTTAAVAHKMGRRWIAVEQLEDGIQTALERLMGVVAGDAAGISKAAEWQGGGSFVYCELKQLNEDYVARIQAASKTEELLALWDEIERTDFVSYRVHPEDFNAKSFEELLFEDQQRLLMATLDKNLLYVNIGDLDNGDYSVADEDKAFNRSFYELTDAS